jgi:hypothetical protein
VPRQSGGDEETGADAGARVRWASRESSRCRKGLPRCADGRGGAGGGFPAGRPGSGASEIEVVGQGLAELEVRDGVGLGGVEGRCLIEEPGEEIALGLAAGG